MTQGDTMYLAIPIHQEDLSVGCIAQDPACKDRTID